MGYFKHHAIVVTDADLTDKRINEAREQAIKCGCSVVSEVTKQGVNGYRSFLVAPDGSKEGWETSLGNDNARESFKLYLKINGFTWVEVIFGDEYGSPSINDSSDSDDSYDSDYSFLAF